MRTQYKRKGFVGNFRNKVNRKTKETYLKIQLLMSCLIGVAIGYFVCYFDLVRL